MLPEEVTHRDVNIAAFRDKGEVFQTIKCDLALVRMRIMMLMIRDTLKSISAKKENPMDMAAQMSDAVPGEGRSMRTRILTWEQPGALQTNGLSCSKFILDSS